MPLSGFELVSNPCKVEKVTFWQLTQRENQDFSRCTLIQPLPSIPVNLNDDGPLLALTVFSWEELSFAI